MTWWRANRWWLVILPVCLAGMAVASAYRVQSLWWDQGLHHEIARAAPGRTVSVTDDYSDLRGKTSRTFRVRLAGVTQGARMPADFQHENGSQPPPGDQVLVARLDWAAAPDQSLTGCTVALVDDHGGRYEPPLAGFAQSEPCVPSGHEGPSLPISAAVPRGAVDAGSERPSTWSTTVKVLAPIGVHIVAVQVWWAMPEYVDLPVD